MKNLILTGIFAIPSLDLHNKIAPQRSIKVPSTKTLDSFATYKQQIEYFLFKSQQKKDVLLPAFNAKTTSVSCFSEINWGGGKLEEFVLHVTEDKL